MDFFTRCNPALIETITRFGTFALAVVSGIATALWAVIRLFDDRKKEREQRRYLELQKLDQQRMDERGRRAERVATLISEFGKSADPEVRVWTTLALSLYPEETVRLLAMSLGEFRDEAVKGVLLALVGVGEAALPDLVKLNKVAQAFENGHEEGREGAAPSLYDTGRLLERTRVVIQHLLFQLGPDQRKRHDLSGIDLAGCNFQGLRLDGLSLEHCRLTGVNFRKASLKGSCFRGSKLDGAVFLGASLNGSDFTGVEGKLNAIHSYPEEARFAYADIRESDFSGASLRKSSFVGSHLEKASLGGAQLHECLVEKSFFSRIRARKMRGDRVYWKYTKLQEADIAESAISESLFEQCEMMGMSALKIDARKSRFINCNLGGTDFSGADLTGAQFRGCNLGGADFRGCNLTGTRFHACEMETAVFDTPCAFPEIP